MLVWRERCVHSRTTALRAFQQHPLIRRSSTCAQIPANRTARADSQTSHPIRLAPSDQALLQFAGHPRLCSPSHRVHQSAQIVLHWPGQQYVELLQPRVGRSVGRGVESKCDLFQFLGHLTRDRRR